MIADLKPYPEYKEAHLPWLDSIPKHWEMAPNRALMRDQREVVGARASDYTLLSLTLRGVIARDMVNPKGKFPAQFNTYKVVRPDDFVFCLFDIDETPRGVGISPLKGMITGAYDVFSPTHRINPRYLYYYYFFLDEGKLMKPLYTGLRKTIQRGVFASLKAPLPPPAEQAAIVRFLDWANGRLDRAIRAKRKVIALLNEQKQAIIHRAVTRGLDSSVPLKPSGIPWLGDIPQHWEARRIKQVCAAIVDCKNRTPAMIPGGKFTVVRTTNIRRGRFNLKGSFTTDQKNYEIWTQRGAPRVGDVFFTREAPVGEACLVPDLEGLCMGQRMMYFRPNTTILDSEFLLNSIYGPVTRTYIEVEANGSTVGHLRLGQVSALPLLWCPIGEQKRIVAHIAAATAPLNTTISRLEREIELLREYRTRLVADVVTGKLDVRDAAERLGQREPFLEAMDTHLHDKLEDVEEDSLDVEI